MQNALVLNHKHGEFTLGTRPIPQVGPGDILVKIRAAPLNPVDWKIQKWGFLVEEYPAVLGHDIAGDVIAIGENVTKFSVGDRVFGAGLPYPDYGAFQEYCKLKEDFSAKIPETATYEEAATFPVALMASYQGLYNDPPYGMALTPLVPSGQGKYKGEAILVLGGGSSVGQLVIQFARASGFSAIITTASTKHTEKLKGLGATHIIDRHVPLDTIHDHISGILDSVSTNERLDGQVSRKVKYIFDAVSEPETQKASYELLAPGGRLGLVLPAHIPMDSTEKHVTLTIGYPDTSYNKSCNKALYSGLTSLIEMGVLKPSNIEIVPGGLGVIVENLKRLENNQVSGVKLVVRPTDK